MRLPGTRYQEHGWEGVRKLLGACSLVALHRCDLDALSDPGRHAALLDDYLDTLAPVLHAAGRAGRAAGNSYGDSVADLAMALLVELGARPAFWQAFAAGLAAEHIKQGPFWRHESGNALLRKKVNDLYATLRDQVDADNYTAATGLDCSANRMYTYRMLDMACRAIDQVFAGWPGTAAQVDAILGRPGHCAAAPIEIRQAGSGCRPEWLIRWSETLERFGGAPGPLHTRSKRFASLRNQPDRIGAMLAEIGAYGQLSANADGADWVHDADTSAQWLDDLARVEAESDAQAGVCTAPGHASMEAALAALRAEPLPVRQAVFLKLLGPADDSYPAEWCSGGMLPTLQQLALRAQVSVPTLRKRRDAAIARLPGRANEGDGND